MSVRLTSQESRVALYDSVTGMAFGPTFATDEEAEAFLAWLRDRGEHDARQIPQGTMRMYHNDSVRAGHLTKGEVKMAATTTFRTMSDVRAANAAAGQHWFSRDTMRFFRSRILPTLYAGRYFVTSEQYDWDAQRLYTVREALPDGSIETVGDFQGYQTAEDARRAIRELTA